MRIVRSGQIVGQYRCAVLPNRIKDPEGFIDTGQVLAGWDQPVTISIAAVREMARMIGFVSPEEVEGHVKRLREMEQELSELREQVDTLAQANEAVSKILQPQEA